MPEDEGNVCASNHALIDRQLLSRVSEIGKGGTSDGVKVGVFAEPEVISFSAHMRCRHPLCAARCEGRRLNVVKTTCRKTRGNTLALIISG